MNIVKRCCSPPYEKLGRVDSDEQGMKLAVTPGHGRVEVAESKEIAVTIDGVDEVSEGRSRRDGGGKVREDHTIWRESSYDFVNDTSKFGGVCKSDMEGSSEDTSRSFDFRQGDADPPSKLIGNFLHRQKLSGDFSLDMDIEMDELQPEEQKQRQDGRSNNNGHTNNNNNNNNGRGLSSVPENSPVGSPGRMQSEANSPHEGVGSAATKSPPRPSLRASSASTNSSMNARTPSASPRDFRVSFEPGGSPRVAIGSPVYEGGPRYRHSESGTDHGGDCSRGHLESNSNDNINAGGSSERRWDDHGDSEVLKCTSRASSGKTNLMRTKTRSRLLDPAPPTPQRELRAADSKMRSGQLRKSGMIGKSGMLAKTGMLEKLEEEEDDPFKDDDIPDEFRRAKWGVLSILQWVSLVIIVAAFVCSLTIPYLTEKELWDLHLWKWALLVLVLFCGRLVSGWAIRIAVFFVERNFLLRKRVLYFVYGVRKAVQNCLWLGLVLIAWNYVLDKKVQRKTKSKSLTMYVSKALVCLLVGTAIWLVKTLLVKVLASSFHVATFFDRIQETLFSQYVLESLSGPPVMEIERCIQEEEKVMKDVERLKEAGADVPLDLKCGARASGVSPRSGLLGRSGVISKSQRSLGVRSGRNEEERDENGITIDHLHKLNQKNVSAWKMKRLMNIVRHGVLSTLDDSIGDAAYEDESAGQIRSEREAKAAAKKIFRNVAKPGAKCITLEDLMRFLREDEAEKAMAFFEGAQETRRVTKSALKNWVVNVFRERRALALTLNDTKTAVNRLHKMVNVVVGVLIIIIWLLILGIATAHVFILISSQLVLVAFVFGNTCKTVFESIIFLFVMHPFDVGDRCSVEGVQMVVEEMNILTTVFLRYDNEKISYPNSVLATKPISNFYRSPDMGDGIDFTINIATPAEKVSIMKERIKRFIENKQDHWYPNPLIVVKDIEDMNKMKMAVWLQHRMNHQDMGEKWLRRSHLIEEMIKIFRDLEIEYRLLPRDVNLRTMPPVAISSNRLPSTWMT